MPYADPELRKLKAAQYSRAHYLRNKAAKNAATAARRLAPDTVTLDRTIPALGYVRGNVRVLSWRANMLKRDATRCEIALLHRYMEANS